MKLTALLTTALLAIAPFDRAHAQTTFVRKNVTSTAAQTDLANYAKGVAKMKVWTQQDPLNPLGWNYQANIHGTTDAPPPGKTPEDMLWDQCQHNSFFFLSWHRMYLHYFERIVRKACEDPTFALPYWDYTGANASARILPQAFRVPANANNPLWVRDNDINGGGRDSRINRAVNPGAMDPSDTSTTDAFAARNFSPRPLVPRSFGGGPSSGGLLEGVPHGAVHVAVGGSEGLMSAFETAGRDPIFWLHHANVDHLWEKWLRLGQGRANPTTNNAWMTTKFTFFDENKNRVQLTGQQIVDTVTGLSYRYDDIPAAPLIANNAQPSPDSGAASPNAADAAPAVPVPTIKTKVTENVAAPIILGSTPLSVAVTIPTSGGANLRSALDAAAQAAPGDPNPAPVVMLKLEGIKFDRIPSGNYKVFLNLPEGEKADDKSPYFVDVIPFFSLRQHKKAGEHAAHEAAAGARWEVDVTRKIAALKELGRWKEGELKVTFVQNVPTTEDGQPLVLESGKQCEIGNVILETQTR